jgi:arylformamidase
MRSDSDTLAFEAEYNLRARHADYEDFLSRWRDESARVRGALAGEFDVRYGDGPDATLDIFAAEGDAAPILVFIHGGYWRGLDKADFSFVAEPFVQAGVSVASLNYSLAPAVTIDAIVEQCRAALGWLHRNAERCNGEPERLFVCGHSAGGHLTAMMMLTDWAARGLPADLVKGGTPISGLFDLAPIRQTSINDDVRLDRESAARNSPIALLSELRAPGTPLIAAVGADETAEFVRQSRAFAEAWRRRGAPSAVMELADPASPLTQAILEQFEA